MAFTAGQKVRASELNRLGQLVARNQRTTNKDTITTIAAVLSVRAPVVAGRSYRISTQMEVIKGAATSDETVVQSEMRYTTNDVEPTTSSTFLSRGAVHVRVSAVQEILAYEGRFDCTTSGWLRVLVTLARINGSGNVAVVASTTGPGPMYLNVEDLGDTVTATGTVY